MGGAGPRAVGGVRGLAEVDPALLVDETVVAVVQVDGVVRDRVEVLTTTGDDELVALALARPAVQRAIGAREVRRTVARPPRLVNVVTA